ncbi:PREDICTED: LOB domain-containing protein 7-like [Erythranthe guttata]|uniref:LOB domain-containing protein 7-like n=1 Tax=Erythranthe guttata TaxID=4155 RepID=UPI00064DE308|nr:PREDICTED: LOB domain-containing protein 7-like [Erythranthe guttata]|eukprot:XP_012852620.1 PREDICTED: LOB domain-containing protein 7-like [Erythranthe guttata]
MANVAQKACAACKHQRRKCDQNCVLAKYFPAEKSDDFENVYHLFGMQNTLKILKSVEEEEGDATIESLIMEAEMRLEHPVHGHFSVTRKLSIEIEKTETELEFVRKQIQLCKGVDNRPGPSTREGRPDQL